MTGFRAAFRLAVAATGLLIAGMAAAEAAGAFAVGACGAYGYAYDYTRSTDARTAALGQCSGQCKVVGVMRRGCAALSVDVKQPCGSYGWAIKSHLGQAQNLSLRRCYEFGGRDCVVRAWVCDEKG
jgi:hypothetical protein